MTERKVCDCTVCAMWKMLGCCCKNFVLITFSEKRGRVKDLLEIVDMIEERAEKCYIEMEKEPRAHEVEIKG